MKTLTSVAWTAGALALLVAFPSAALSIWTSKTNPRQATVDDPNPVELGLRVCFEQPGRITGVRVYQGPLNAGPRLASVWSAAGERLASGTTPGVASSSGWQQAELDTAVQIVPGTEYVVSYFTPTGYYAADNEYFTLRPRIGTIAAYGDDEFGANGVYRYGAESAFPDQTYRGTNYWVDPLFITDNPTSVWVGTHTIFGSCLGPSEYEGADAPVELGIRFGTSRDGEIRGITFYRAPGSTFPADTLAYQVRLWNADTGEQIAQGLARISQNPTSGKLTGIFDRTVRVQAGVRYIASYHAPDGGYGYTPGVLATGYQGNLGVGADVSTVSEGGVYAYGPPGTLPTQSFNGGHYWVDVIFVPDAN